MCEFNFSFAEVTAEKKTFHEFRHHKMLKTQQMVTYQYHLHVDVSQVTVFLIPILVLKILVLNQRTSMQVCHHH